MSRVISGHCLLLDTASLYFRAFYGVPATLRAPDGTPVNAVRGLLDFLARLIEDYHPTHLACAWDNDWRPQWRVELIPSYKTHRVTVPSLSAPVGAGGRGEASGVAESAPDELAVQVPLIIEVLASLGLPIVGHREMEADDVLGTLATRVAAEPELRADVVTGDRDLFQLVDDEHGVRVLYIAKGVGRHEQVTNAWIRERYGIDARCYVDYATLRGDPSDGLPGVAGIGEKTAASLLERYGSLDAVLAAASAPGTPLSAAVRARLAAAIDYLAVAPEVVAVRRDLDLDLDLDDLRLHPTPAEPERFARLTTRLGLGGSSDRVLASLGSLA